MVITGIAEQRDKLSQEGQKLVDTFIETAKNEQYNPISNLKIIGLMLKFFNSRSKYSEGILQKVVDKLDSLNVETEELSDELTFLTELRVSVDDELNQFDKLEKDR